MDKKIISGIACLVAAICLLPLLGVIEKPDTPPATIEDDFNAHYGNKAADSSATPAE